MGIGMMMSQREALDVIRVPNGHEEMEALWMMSACENDDRIARMGKNEAKQFLAPEACRRSGIQA